jgi:hypothetical protein
VETHQTGAGKPTQELEVKDLRPVVREAMKLLFRTKLSRLHENYADYGHIMQITRYAALEVRLCNTMSSKIVLGMK